MIIVCMSNSWRKEFLTPGLAPSYGDMSYGDNIKAWHRDWKEWLYENCQGYWFFTLDNSDGGCTTNVNFENESDAVAFKLAWA